MTENSLISHLSRIIKLLSLPFDNQCLFGGCHWIHQLAVSFQNTRGPVNTCRSDWPIWPTSVAAFLWFFNFLANNPVLWNYFTKFLLISRYGRQFLEAVSCSWAVSRHITGAGAGSFVGHLVVDPSHPVEQKWFILYSGCPWATVSSTFILNYSGHFLFLQKKVISNSSWMFSPGSLITDHLLLWL